MRRCKYLGTDFCKAYGIQFSVYVEQWATIAEVAEIEAHNMAIERART